MNFFVIALLVTLFTRSAHAQKEDDNLILVSIADTANLDERVRHAITYTDLISREDSRKDTIITYSERIDGTQ